MWSKPILGYGGMMCRSLPRVTYSEIEQGHKENAQFLTLVSDTLPPASLISTFALKTCPLQTQAHHGRPLDLHMPSGPFCLERPSPQCQPAKLSCSFRLEFSLLTARLIIIEQMGVESLLRTRGSHRTWERHRRPTLLSTWSLY